MALTGVVGSYSIDLTLDNATDWTWAHATLGWGATSPGVRLQAIHWRPLATDNSIKIRDGSVTGAVIFEAKAATAYDQRIIYFDSRLMMKPCIKASETAGLTSVTFIMRGTQK